MQHRRQPSVGRAVRGDSAGEEAVSVPQALELLRALGEPPKPRGPMFVAPGVPVQPLRPRG
jgi:hypothetical protein